MISSIYSSIGIELLLANLNYSVEVENLDGDEKLMLRLGFSPLLSSEFAILIFNGGFEISCLFCILWSSYCLLCFFMKKLVIFGGKLLMKIYKLEQNIARRRLQKKFSDFNFP